MDLLDVHDVRACIAAPALVDVSVMLASRAANAVTAQIDVLDGRAAMLLIALRSAALLRRLHYM